MFDSVKQWLPLAGLVFVLWFVAYIFFWLDRVECGAALRQVCLYEGFGNWLGDVVMFGWVDTTLAAGILTLLAGAFVLLTFVWQRDDQNAERRASEKAKLRETIISVNVLFRRYLRATTTGDVVAMEGLRLALEDRVLGLVGSAFDLANWLQRILFMLDRETRRALELEEDEPDLSEIAGLACLAAAYLGHSRRLISEDGEYQQVPAQASVLRVMLSEFGGTEGLFASLGDGMIERRQ